MTCVPVMDWLFAPRTSIGVELASPERLRHPLRQDQYAQDFPHATAEREPATRRDSLRSRIARFRQTTAASHGCHRTHGISLLWFTAFATTCAVAFLVVAGCFRSAPAPTREIGALRTRWLWKRCFAHRPSGGYRLVRLRELRWSTLIVVAAWSCCSRPDFSRRGRCRCAMEASADRIGGNQVLALAALRRSAAQRGRDVVIGWR